MDDLFRGRWVFLLPIDLRIIVLATRSRRQVITSMAEHGKGAR